MKKKALIFVLIMFGGIFLPYMAAAQSIKYYQSRIWSNTKYSWDYISPIGVSDAKKLKLYFMVYYKKQKISHVKYPYFKEIESGALRGISIEYYNKRQQVVQRNDLINNKKIGFYKFIYGNGGRLEKEKYYQVYVEYVNNNNVRSKKKVHKLHFVFNYFYNNDRLVKRTCHQGEPRLPNEPRQPVGMWVYYNNKGQIVKKEKYDLNEESLGVLSYTTFYQYNSQGNVTSEKSYHSKKPFGNWYFYNLKGQVIREEFYNVTLIRYYKYSYNSSGVLQKVQLYEENRLKETMIYNDKGKIIKRVWHKKDKKK
ncbi:MAG: hypothetical protein OEZ36_05980 [Spirochaetota bacterium]|nr:hypothetical protein [Spirochaetota bacterium]